MKILALILFFLMLSGCVSQATSITEFNRTAQPTPTVENANAAANNQMLYSTYLVDSALLDKLKVENERFRTIPDEFKTADFKNYKYDFGRLKNGERDDREPGNPLAGSQIFTLTDAFYVDLFGDEKKEAVVFLYAVGCGVSCDGGADLIYFFTSHNGRVKTADSLWTGSNSGGCSLKSFTIKANKIYIEQFGKCDKNASYDERGSFACKFCTKDETHSVYSFSNNTLKRESFEVIETEQINVMNSPALISISE